VSSGVLAALTHQLRFPICRRMSGALDSRQARPGVAQGMTTTIDPYDASLLPSGAYGEIVSGRPSSRGQAPRLKTCAPPGLMTFTSLSLILNHPSSPCLRASVVNPDLLVKSGVLRKEQHPARDAPSGRRTTGGVRRKGA
jgi:hypothetical protein